MRRSLLLRLAAALLAALLVCLGAYNFVAMILQIDRLGGDAMNGYVHDGHYFVSNHGRYTEVSAEDWNASRTRERTVFVTQPLAIAGMAYLVIAVLIPAAAGRPSPQAPERIRSIVASGPPVASGRCRGRVGKANLPVRVTVHPGGLVVKPQWSSERAVTTPEIRAVRAWSWMFARGIEIDHAGVDMATPLRLLVADTSDVAAGIRKIAPWSG